MSVNHIKQLEALKEKRKALQEKEEAIKAELIGSLSAQLIEADALSVDLNILIGGILEVIKKAKQGDKVTEEWKLAGQKFCQKRKRKRAGKEDSSFTKKATEHKNDGQ